MFTCCWCLWPEWSSLKQLLVILSERVSRGGQHWPTLARRRRSKQWGLGKQLEPPCKERLAFGLLATATNDNSSLSYCSKSSKKVTHNRLFVGCFSLEPSILLFGFPLPFTCLSSSHVITLGLRPANQLPLRF